MADANPFETRCPACGRAFASAAREAACPACGRTVRARPLGMLDAIARESERRRGRSVAGAPAGPAGSPPRLAALIEDVRSLWNVGAMFRTADGAGVGELYLCGITGCPPDPALAKTALGAEDAVRWEHYRSALDVLPALVAAGVQLVALERTAESEPLAAAVRARRTRAPLCLLVGNEVDGLSPEVQALAHLRCHLPMRGAKSSLNAAVAFGIAAYALAEEIER